MGIEGQRREPNGKRPDTKVGPFGVKAPEERLCCGGNIKAQLFKFPNPYGLRLIAAQWHCPRCGQIEAEYVWKDRKRTRSAKPSPRPRRTPLRSRKRLEA